MELSFSVHAIKRMEERGIGFEEVLQCLNFPDKIHKESFSKIKYYKLIGEAVLILVCSINENECTIITVIKSSKIRKYL